MVITKDIKIRKKMLEVNNCYLTYKQVMKYLGIQISDTGSVKKDADLLVDNKRGEIYTKFTNFCGYLTPLTIKLKVLNTCLISSILYGCACWGSFIPKGLEVTHRIAIKTALGIRNNISNEIVYLESGLYPLDCTIKKWQFAFWLKVENCDNLVMNKILNKANAHELESVKFYKERKERYGSPTNCEKSMQLVYLRKWREKIDNAANEDENSNLGTYYNANHLSELHNAVNHNL